MLDYETIIGFLYNPPKIFEWIFWVLIAFYIFRKVDKLVTKIIYKEESVSKLITIKNLEVFIITVLTIVILKASYESCVEKITSFEYFRFVLLYTGVGLFSLVYIYIGSKNKID